MEPLVFPNHILHFYRLVYFKPFTLHKHLNLIEIKPESVKSRRHRRRLLENQSGHISALIASVCAINLVSISLVVVLSMWLADKSIKLEISNKLLLVLFATTLAFTTILLNKVIRQKTLIFTKKDFIVLFLIFFVALIFPINRNIAPILSIVIPFSTYSISLFLGIFLGFELGMTISLVLFSPLFSINILLIFSVAASALSWAIASVVLGKTLASGEIAFGISFIFSLVFSSARLPIYIYETTQTFFLNPLSLNNRLIDRERYQIPIFWDEIILFPLLRLDKQLVTVALKNRRAGLEIIAATASSFRQSWAARNAIIQLISEDIKHTHNLSEIANVSSTLAWLPDESRSLYKSLLLGIEEISAYARAALESSTFYNKRERLHQALELTIRIRSGLTFAGGSNLAKQWGAGLSEWEYVFEEELRTLSKREIIPNAFIAGSPLAMESKVFKGRSDLFRALENELSSAAEQHPTLMLFGARRTGKTSVIKQLPIRLGPQVIPVEIDLQSMSTAKNVTGLLNRMSNTIRNSCSDRHIDLPELSKETLEKDPYTVFESWLTTVSNNLEERWLLLALDEYETIGDLIAQNQTDEKFFKLLRSIIQHHSKIILLFSGAHTLEDLPSLWSHYLVNVSILKVDLLRENDARELITKPIPEFNLKFDSGTVDRILDATACHPYLIQLTCRDLVNNLNDSSRSYATMKDIEKALSSALVSGTAYFHDLYYGRDSNKEQQKILATLARLGIMGFDDLRDKTKLPENVLRSALQYLIRRDVIKEIGGGYHFRIELVRRWIENKV